jgi:hypothetical protein
MSNDQIARWKRLQVKVDQLVLEGKRDIGVVLDFYQKVLETRESIQNPYLRLISGGQTIVVGSTDGRETIENSIEAFNGGSCGGFRADNGGQPTTQTTASVYEMAQSGTYVEILTGFGVDFDRLSWQESQVVYFCWAHRHWLSDDRNYETFFLFKEKEGFAIASVSVQHHHVHAYRRPVSDDNTWHSSGPCRFVIPQLMKTDG